MDTSIKKDKILRKKTFFQQAVADNEADVIWNDGGVNRFSIQSVCPGQKMSRFAGVNTLWGFDEKTF